MLTPNPSEYSKRSDIPDPSKKKNQKISRKDKAISQLAAKIVPCPMDSDSASKLYIEEGERKNLLFPTDKKSKFRLFTINNLTKGHSARMEWQTASVTKSGKVILSSKGGQNKKRFDSVNDFIDHYEPISPPSKEQFDKANLMNQLAHAWGLRGSFHIGDGVLLHKTGSYARQCMSTLLDYIDELDFPEEFEHSLFNQDEFKKAVKISLQQTLELEILMRQAKTSSSIWKEVRNKLVEMIDHSDKTGIPAFFSSGFRSHLLYLVYYKHCLSFTNRGAIHPNNSKGTYYFKVDPKILKKKLKDQSFLKKLVGDTGQSEFLKFQPYRKGAFFKGEITEQLQLTFLGFDRKERQKVGNCAFANMISALHSFATMREYLSRRDFPDKGIVEFAHEIKIDHKAFTFAVRTGILDHAAQIFSAEDPQFASDYLAACDKMMKKLHNYETKRVFSCLEDRKKILRLCHYYFEKISFDNKEMSDYYAFVDQVVRLHYPGVREEKALEFLEGRESEWMIIHNEIENTYSICFTDASGSPTKMLFPDTSVPTIEEFNLRFPENRRVPIDDLDTDSHLKAELYQEVQMLSVGRISSSEEQVLLHGERPGTWLVREFLEERGQFAVTFVTFDCQIQTWVLTSESLSTTLEAFYHQFKPEDQVNPLSIPHKLRAFHSGKLEKTPLQFGKPVYLFGALKSFKPPHSKDASIDDIVGAIGKNITSAIPNIEEITSYLNILLSGDTFSPEEIHEIRTGLSRVRGEHFHPVETRMIDQTLDQIMMKKIQVKKWKYEMNLLKKAGVKTQFIEKIFIREDVPIGSWYIAPSDSDENKLTLIMQLSDSKGHPRIAHMHMPIDGEIDYLISKCARERVVYSGVRLHSKLSDEKLPRKLRTKINRYRKNSDFFADLQMRSHENLSQKEAKSLLREQSGTPPLWLVRKSTSTPGAIVMSILDSKGQFLELKYTHEQFLNFNQKRIEKKLGLVFGDFIEPSKAL